MHPRSVTTLCWLHMKTNFSFLVVRRVPVVMYSAHMECAKVGMIEGEAWCSGEVWPMCVLQQCFLVHLGWNQAGNHKVLGSTLLVATNKQASLIYISRLCNDCSSHCFLRRANCCIARLSVHATASHVRCSTHLLAHTVKMLWLSQTLDSLGSSCVFQHAEHGTNAAGQTALYENIGRHNALWTFDITASTWQKRTATGDLPEPHLANALAVVKGKAYALVNDPEGTKQLEVYELDLGQWQWRRLPPAGTQPTCRRAASAVVMQVAVGCFVG